MYFQKIIILASGILFLCLMSCDNRTTESETTELTYTLERKEPSVMFWDYAASTSMLQTELSKLAKEKTQDSAVQAFADSARLIHSKALRKLRNIAVKYKQVQLPDSLTGADEMMVEEFKLLETGEFETRYLDYLEQSNRTQLERYNETLTETEDPALRTWLHDMKMHLRNQLQYYAIADSATEIE